MAYYQKAGILPVTILISPGSPFSNHFFKNSGAGKKYCIYAYSVWVQGLGLSEL